MTDIPREDDSSSELDSAIGAELDADAKIEGNGDRFTIQGNGDRNPIQGNGDRRTIQGNGDRGL